MSVFVKCNLCEIKRFSLNLKIRNPAFETRNLKLGTWNLEPGTIKD